MCRFRGISSCRRGGGDGPKEMCPFIMWPKLLYGRRSGEISSDLAIGLNNLVKLVTRPIKTTRVNWVRSQLRSRMSIASETSVPTSGGYELLSRDCGCNLTAAVAAAAAAAANLDDHS
ncbi:hypothetical protein NL676_026811 [Syzygium grande]|nr:hypothetical protein NL676_026811 [Syzygium grande]